MGIHKAKADLEAVRREISRLEMQLRAAKDRETKIAHYIEMAALYDSEGTDASDAGHNGTHLDIVADTRRTILGGVSGEALSICLIHLRETGKPARTRDLLDIVEQKGIQLGGRNPAANLSSLLSRETTVYSDRIRGWCLREWESKSVTQDIGAAPVLAFEDEA